MLEEEEEDLASPSLSLTVSSVFLFPLHFLALDNTTPII